MLRLQLTHWLIYWVLRLYAQLWRVDLSHSTANGVAAISFWHQHFVILAMIFDPKSVRPLVSKSSDGSLLASVLAMGGFVCLRGSSSQGGSKALAEAVALADNLHPAFALDGPTGPPFVPKAGAVVAAARRQGVVEHWRITVDRCWQLRTWDKVIIPKPGARIRIERLPVHGSSEEAIEWLRIEGLRAQAEQDKSS